MTAHVAPYGSWKSPVSADVVVAGAVGFGQIVLDGADVCWSESRPAEGGRCTVVCHRNGETRDLIDAPFSARTRAHEYGGGAFMCADGVTWFTNDVDQRLYRCEPGAAPKPLTPPVPARYADLLFDRRCRRLIAVREDHSGAGAEPRNELVSISADGVAAMSTLASGADFYSSPCLSPDGCRLAWLSWNHPDMPWDSTELWLADCLPDGTLGGAHRVAGGGRESVFQPQFAPDGTLYLVSDRNGWWNIWRERGGGVEPVSVRAAEFGLPQWVFGMSTYAFASEGTLVAAFNEGGRWRLAEIDISDGRITEIELPYTDVSALRAFSGSVYFVGAAPDTAPAVVCLRLTDRSIDVLRRSNAVPVDAAFLSAPQTLDFPTSNGGTAHGFYYPPHNADFCAPVGEKPPLLVFSHGGPTSATGTGLNLRLQYWTSRGFAVLDVNYRGSTGYGRAYRESLNGAWGIADVEDCIAGARYLADRGFVDGSRMAIRGGSAGGYTTLCALAFHDTFRAGASLYGVSDLEALARDTHKFEARYLDRLIGPYPERRDLYRARSPIHYAHHLSCPTIFFQGSDDKVVPPDQTRRMVEALRARGVAVACLEFEGEAHGFRRAGNIRRVLEVEFYFYSRIFGFMAADIIEPVDIANPPRCG
jgi:dipeptidyl aminopeptidase/acylaminoacyl peptidase